MRNESLKILGSVRSSQYLLDGLESSSAKVAVESKSSMHTDNFSFELFNKTFSKRQFFKGKIFQFYNMVLCLCLLREKSFYQVHAISFYLAMDIKEQKIYHIGGPHQNF